MASYRQYLKAILKPTGGLYLLNKCITAKNLAVYKTTIGLNWLRRLILATKFYFYNSFLTHFPSYKLRKFYLSKILKIKIGKDTSIHMGCFFAGSNIIIGNNTVVARNCQLDGRAGLIEIGNNVSIAPEAYILSMSHRVDSPTFELIIQPVVIEDYAWIATRVMILPGVTAGKGSVMAAGAVVSKSVEPYAVVGGVPAKKIGERTRELNYQLKYFPFFNTDIQ